MNDSLTDQQIREASDSTLDKWIEHYQRETDKRGPKGELLEGAGKVTAELLRYTRERDRRKQEAAKQTRNAERDSQIVEREKEQKRHAEVQREAKRLGWTL